MCTKEFLQLVQMYMYIPHIRDKSRDKHTHYILYIIQENMGIFVYKGSFPTGTHENVDKRVCSYSTD